MDLRRFQVRAGGRAAPLAWVEIRLAARMVKLAAHVVAADALAVLRGAAFTRDRSLTDLAADVLAGRVAADEVSVFQTPAHMTPGPRDPPGCEHRAGRWAFHGDRGAPLAPARRAGQPCP